MNGFQILIDVGLDYAPKPQLTVNFTREHGGIASELSTLSKHAGLPTERGAISHAGPDTDWASVSSEFVAFIGAAGGVRGIAAVLKVFFERTKGAKVQFGERGELLRADGLNTEEIIQLLDSLPDTVRLQSIPRARALIDSLHRAQGDIS